MVGASPEFSECVVRSAAINSYFSSPPVPREVRCWFRHEGESHLRFAVGGFEFAAAPARTIRAVARRRRCAVWYFFPQPPTVISFSPHSRATSAIERLVSITSFATSQRNPRVYHEFLRPTTTPI